jgi:hypothetical protein
VSITAHAFIINSFLHTLGRPRYVLPVGGEAIIVPVVSGYYDLIPFTGVLPIVVKATAVTN